MMNVVLGVFNLLPNSLAFLHTVGGVKPYQSS
jgi:hypothetical protein